MNRQHPRHDGPELRTDLLTGHQVILSNRRGQRPHSPEATRQFSRREVDPACPFCPGNESQTPQPVLIVPGEVATRPWAMRVVPNLFPIVSIPPLTAESAPLHRSIASGVHEVIIETPRHDLELSQRGVSEVASLLGVIRTRLIDLLARPDTQYVSVYKNQGLQAGTSLTHPHSQIVALDFMPQEVRSTIRRAHRHLKSKGQCLLCRMLQSELQIGTRIVAKSNDLVVFAPYASMVAGELLLVPTHHESTFTNAPESLLDDLAERLILVLRAMRSVHDDPPFNLILQTAPKQYLRDEALHWYWRLVPRMTRTAGFELDTGVQVNGLEPDQAAAMLRQAIEQGPS